MSNHPQHACKPCEPCRYTVETCPLCDVLRDGEVLGLDGDGCLVLWDALKRESYNCGESLDQYGPANLTTSELVRLTP